jgi:hypothetical protein
LVASLASIATTNLHEVNMKYLLPLLLLLGCSCASAQQLSGYTTFATILPDLQGQFMQYAFPVSPFDFWIPKGHSKKFQFGASNAVDVATVNGVTELYLADSHDVCSSKAGIEGQCTYLGTLTPGSFLVTPEVGAGGTYQHVTAEFSGAFVDAKGNIFSPVTALLSFDTFPTKDTVNWPSTGGVTIVFDLN